MGLALYNVGLSRRNGQVEPLEISCGFGTNLESVFFFPNILHIYIPALFSTPPQKIKNGPKAPCEPRFMWE